MWEVRNPLVDPEEQALSDYQSDAKELRAVLITATAERNERPDLVDGELEWVRYEREVMHAAVNRLRAGRGLPPVPVELIVRAEELAKGHFDYVATFALGAADIAHERSPR